MPAPPRGRAKSTGHAQRGTCRGRSRHSQGRSLQASKGATGTGAGRRCEEPPGAFPCQAAPALIPYLQKGNCMETRSPGENILCQPHISVIILLSDKWLTYPAAGTGGGWAGENRPLLGSRYLQSLESSPPPCAQTRTWRSRCPVPFPAVRTGMPAAVWRRGPRPCRRHTWRPGIYKAALRTRRAGHTRRPRNGNTAKRNPHTLAAR